MYIFASQKNMQEQEHLQKNGVCLLSRQTGLTPASGWLLVIQKKYFHIFLKAMADLQNACHTYKISSVTRIFLCQL